MQATTMEPKTGVDHPRNRALAAGALLFYGLLLVVADVLGVREQAGMPTASIWSILHLAVVALLAVGVLQAQHWAWWGSLVMASVALFLLAPVVIALVGGSGLAVLVPTVHLVLVCLEGVTLVFLIALLTRLHRLGGR
jgi:hypothetical protein